MRNQSSVYERTPNAQKNRTTTGNDPPAFQGGTSPPEPTGAKPGTSRKKRKRSPVLRFLLKLALLAAFIWAVFTYVLGLHIMHGYGMHPNIKDGDLVVTYKLEPYRVGDVVAYKNPETGETALSRIIAIGSNEIQITEIGELLVNGSIPDEGVFYPTQLIEGSAVTFPYQVSDEGFFLLDDYRTQGRDSRVFGELREDALLGKVAYVLRRRGI